MPESRAALAALFRATGQAHHRAFAATNGDDPEWPAWYAQFLALPLAELLGRSFSTEVLAKAFEAADQEMRKTATAAEWSVYYADWFLARYSGRGERGGA